MIVGASIAAAIYFGVQKFRGVQSESSFDKRIEANMNKAIKSGKESRNKDFVVDSINSHKERARDSINR